MIQTAHKDKLPRFLSYPIGAEALTKQLTGEPHSELFAVWFSTRVTFGLSKAKHAKLLVEDPSVVLVGQYQPAFKPGYGSVNSLVEAGWYDRKWSLTVYAVIRELRHRVSRSLEQHGMPLVIQWLRGSVQQSWLLRTQRISLVFSPTDDSIAPFERSGV